MTQQPQQPQSKSVLPPLPNEDENTRPLRRQQQQQQRLGEGRRHRSTHRMAHFFIILATLFSGRQCFATAFTTHVTQQRTHRSTSNVVDRTSRCTSSITTTRTQLHVSHELRGSWSNPGTSSRFGVRKRVKAVLAKARSRSKGSVTETASTTFYPQTRSAGLVIPQTASTTATRTPSPQPYYLGPATYFPRTSDGVDETPERFLFRDRPSASKVPSSTPGRILTAADDPDDQLPDLSESASLAASKSAEGEFPLPFTLPTLSPAQRQLLAAGERIQEQSKMGREGSGYVVLDVDAPDYVVWECLLDFEKYPSFIGTVREMRLYDMVARPTEYDVPARPSAAAPPGTAPFRLNIAAVHTYQPHPAGHFMEFTLDKSCRNAVLKHAKGIWHTESNPEGREGVTRVWLLCELQVSSVLPSFIVDYTAKKAMPRASNWIRPTVEAKKREMNIS